MTVTFRAAPGEAVLGRFFPSTGADGLTAVYFEHTGFADVRAFDGRSMHGALDGIAIVPGISAETRPIVLRPLDEGASLALEVVCRGCGEPSPFLCILQDPDSEIDVLRLQSEDVEADGLCHGLPAGTFDLVLGRRTRSPGSLHELGQKQTLRVELAPGQVTSAHFEVDCRAQLRLLASCMSADRPGSFKAWLVPEGAPGQPAAEPKPEWLLWRSRPEPEEWKVSQDAPLDQIVILEQAHKSGSYTLIVRADGCQEWRQSLVLEPCAEIAREIVLSPVEQGR